MGSHLSMNSVSKTVRLLGLIRSQPSTTVSRISPGALVSRNASSQSGGGGNNQNNQNDRNGLGAAIALVSGAALAVKLYSEQDNRHSLLAETTPEDFSHENRVRMYMALDKIFNYFASYQITTSKGRKRMMMTPPDFYAAITPD